MRIALISFTEKGGRLCREISDKLSLAGEMCLAYTMKKESDENGLIQADKPLTKWTKEAFDNNEAVIFVGAVGIAVRAIAPYIRSKDEDPAVICLDEQGNFVISLLSGHLGGANQLAASIAEEIGAVPVITTATDINGSFSVDVWAKEQNLKIVNLKAAKQVSADILSGKTVYFYYEGNIEGSLPEGLEAIDVLTLKEKIKQKHTCIVVTEKRLESLRGSEDTVLQLVPKNICIGMGCKKNTPYKNVLELFERVMDENQIRYEGVRSLSSIDLKRQEKAFLKLSKKLEIPFVTFSGEELTRVNGEFTPSAFVRSITGVENVCERAAVAAAGENSNLFVKKIALNGVTVAVAKINPTLKFTEKS